MDPMLIEIPRRIDTARLMMRCPRNGDGLLLQAMQTETMAGLRPWMHWAQEPPKPDDCEIYCRRMQARFILREDLVWFVFERDGGHEPGRLVASVGLHRIDWGVRRFEIGYWRRSGCGGQGFVTEAVRALTRLCFAELDARRVEIRMDHTNVPSWKVAERAGFTLDGVLRQDSLSVDGKPRDTRVYSRVPGVAGSAQDTVPVPPSGFG